MTKLFKILKYIERLDFKYHRVMRKLKFDLFDDGLIGSLIKINFEHRLKGIFFK